jgi:PAS domain S-box-containing protein
MDQIHLLLVEQDSERAMLVRQALDHRMSRFQVSVVESGKACLAALRDDHCDLILLDYRVPPDGGLGILREIRQAGYQSPVILMTDQDDEGIIDAAIEAGAVDCIEIQSGDLAQLGSVVNKALRQHQLGISLVDSQNRYRTLFESSRDPIFLLDGQIRVVDLNASAEKLLGSPRTEIIGAHFFDWVRPEPAAQVASWQQELRSKGKAEITFSFTTRQDRHGWAELSADRVGQSRQQEHFLCILHNVTQSRQDQDIWNALNRASLAAHNQLEPESIFKAVAQVLLELGLGSSVWWLSENRRFLQVRFCASPKPSEDPSHAGTVFAQEDLWISVDQTPVFRDQVMKGETVFFDDHGEFVSQLAESGGAHLQAWALENLGAGSVVLVPLTAAARIPGVFLISGDLNQQSVPAARAFARQISSALEHARLFTDAQRRIGELEALQEIGLKLSSDLEMRRLMEAITDVALRLTDAHNCHIYLVNERGFEFVAARRRDGSKEPAVSQPRPDGLVARVAELGEPLFLENAQDDPLYQGAESSKWGVKAIAGFPLLRTGQVLGVFTLTYLESHRFDPSERRILNLLVDQAAAAVEIAQLYLDLSRHSQDLSTLYSVALAVSAQLRISDVLEVTYEAVSQATGARTFAVGLYDEKTDQLVFEMVREEGQDISHANLLVSDSQSLMAWVAHNRQELIISNVQEAALPAPGIAIGGPVLSWMGFPLIAGTALVGVMSVQSRHPHAFDEGHQRLCWGIATQVAIALEKARLLGEVQQHNWELSVLNRISAIASHSLDLDTLLDEALSIILDQMRLEAGAFHLFDKERDELTLVEQRNLPREAEQELQRITVDQWMYDQVALSGKPMVVNHNEHQGLIWPRHSLKVYKAAATIPLLSKDEMLGTLSVFNHLPRPFTAREVDLLLAIGQQIGVAVHNALLYRKTIDRERRLARLYEAARSLSSVLEAQALLHRVLETAMGELPASGACLWLQEEEMVLIPHLASGTLSRQDAEPDLSAQNEVELVLRGRQVVLWGNRHNPQRWTGLEVTGKRGYRAAVPLRGQASEIGVLEVVTAAGEDGLTGDDVEFLSTLAGIAAIARENAQLYDAVAQYAISLEAKINDRTADVRREKERTEAILRSVADGVFVLGVDSKIVLTNPAAEMLLNVSAEQSSRLYGFLAKLAGQPDSDAPGPTITLDGQTLQARAAKIRYEDVELGTVIVLRDVTHFEQVNRLKSEFVSTASHELRTPLSNVKLYLSLLQRGRIDKRDAYHRVLAQEVNRLETLVKDLLDLSRLEPREEMMEKEWLNLSDIVSHVLSVLSPQAEAKQISLTCSFQTNKNELWIQANTEHMVQMVMNLTANAINYTEPQGQVLLVLATQTDPRGRWVTLTIKDTGVGISPGDLPRIFERFYRGQIQQHMCSGTGLGLAIVKEILDRHNGWITVDSEVGSGSLFTVGLPAAASPENLVDPGT